MNRRAFFTTVAAGLILPRTAAAQATPAASLPPRPAPVDLGDGMTLIDYRLHPGGPDALIGEIRNDTNSMVDAPVVSLTWQDDGDTEAFTWLSPILPVLYSGGTSPVYGPLPVNLPSSDVVREATFALCTIAEPDSYTMLTQALKIEMVVLDEVISSDVYRLRGTVTNTGKATAREIEIRGIVRDAQGRVAGLADSVLFSSIPVGRSYNFSMYAYADPRFANGINPFPLIEGVNYSVDVAVGLRGPITRRGCDFGRPWD